MIIDLTPELTNFSNNNFSIIGRALALATNFEKTFKTYLFALVIRYRTYFKKEIKEFNKINNSNNDEVFKQIFKKISFDRSIKIVTNIAAKGFPEVKKIKKELLKAKDARNFIAHELCVGYYDSIETDEFRNFLLNELKDKITLITRCTMGLEVLINVYNKEELNINVDNCTKKLVDWAIDVFD